MRTLFDIEREDVCTGAYIGLITLVLAGAYLSFDFFFAAFIVIFFLYCLAVFAFIKVRGYIDTRSLPYCVFLLAFSAVLFVMSRNVRRLYLSASIVAFVLFVAAAVRFAVLKIRGKDTERNNLPRALVLVFISVSMVFASAPMLDRVLSLVYAGSMEPTVLSGRAYYEDGSYANQTYGDTAYDILPRKDELSDVRSVDFLYVDYSLLDTLFFDSNTQYLLKVEYGDSEYERAKAEAKEKDGFAELLGDTSYSGCLIERRTLPYGQNAYNIVCYSDRTKSIMYVVLIDDRVEDACINYLHTEDTGFLDHTIWQD